MSEVELVILGKPIAKMRPRVSMKNGIIRTFTPKETEDYEKKVAKEYKTHYVKPMFSEEDLISAMVIYYFGLNKSDFGKKGLNKSDREKMGRGFATIHKDIDNLLKTIFDSLNGICYPDDMQIVQVFAEKRYTAETPRVEIELESIEYENK